MAPVKCCDIFGTKWRVSSRSVVEVLEMGKSMHLSLAAHKAALIQCPCWDLSISNNTYNGHVKISTGSWSNEKTCPGQRNNVFFYIMWTAVCKCVGYMQKWEKASQWRKWDALAMFCLETFGSGIKMDVILTMPLLKSTVSPIGSCHFWKDNVKHITHCRNCSLDPNPIGSAEQTP